MNSLQNLYALGLNESAHLIATIGHMRTVILEGHIGTGKTSVEKILSELKPNHRVVRFDCTNKDLGDLFLPNMADLNGEPFVRFIPNEELGVHLNEPIILNFDEIGKANPSVIKGVRRVMLELRSYTQTLSCLPQRTWEPRVSVTCYPHIPAMPCVSLRLASLTTSKLSPMG